MKKQAVLIVAHNQPQLLKYNLSLLDSEYIDIFIHVDKKCKEIDIEEIATITQKSKVKVISERNVQWGGMEQVNIEIFRMLELATQNGKYAYYHLISGSDLLIKPVNEFIDYFSKCDEEFVDFESNNLKEEHLKRIKYYWVFVQLFGKRGVKLDSALIKLQQLLKIDRTKNSQIQFQKGAVWYSITDEFARYVLREKEKYVNYYKYTCCSDEMVLQTILIQSRFFEKLHDKSLNNETEKSIKRLILWDEEASSPRTLTLNDYDKLKETEAFFARKFDYNKSSEIIDLILDLLN